MEATDSGAAVGPESWGADWTGEAGDASGVGVAGEPGELVMMCVDRMYEGEEQQARWRLGLLSGADLAEAEKVIKRLLEIIQETKKQ